MTLQPHCFAFKRPDEPWRGTGSSWPNLIPPCDSSKGFVLQPLKTHTFLVENLFLTKFQTCKQIPRCGRELNLQPDVSLARDLALNITARSVMKTKPADCNGNDLYKCFRYKNALATVQTSAQCADNTLIPGNVMAASCALLSHTVEVWTHSWSTSSIAWILQRLWLNQWDYNQLQKFFLF